MSNIDLDNMPSMEELLQQSEQKDLTEGTIYSGKVVTKNDKGVLVDIGGKAESFVDRSDLRNFDDLKIGDTVEVYLERREGEGNLPVVNVKKAETQRTWDDIVNNHEEGSLIKGKVMSRVKGGLNCVDKGNFAFEVSPISSNMNARQDNFLVARSRKLSTLLANAFKTA